jgi:hypothetical protein
MNLSHSQVCLFPNRSNSNHIPEKIKSVQKAGGLAVSNPCSCSNCGPNNWHISSDLRLYLCGLGSSRGKARAKRPASSSRTLG